MTVKDKLLHELNSAFPGKKFDIVLRIEEHTFRPFNMITVNGKATAYGYHPELVQDLVAQNHMTVDEWVMTFLRTNGNYFRGIV